MKKLATAAAIAIGVTFAATPVAHADNNWMAMAISDATGQIRISDGAPTQAKAEQQAMAACGKSDCRVLASGGPGGCIAMVVNAAKTHYFGRWGPTTDEAEAAALAAAGGGTVLKDHGHCLGDPLNQ